MEKQRNNEDPEAKSKKDKDKADKKADKEKDKKKTMKLLEDDQD
jgi:hypothetical protein